MEARDFYRLCDRMRMNWRNMFPTKEHCLSWFTYLQEFESQDVEQGVIRYILNNTKEPTIADIINSVKKVREDKRRATPIQSGREIRCIHCRDTGLIVWEDKDGRMYGRPCDCEKGTESYVETEET